MNNLPNQKIITAVTVIWAVIAFCCFGSETCLGESTSVMIRQSPAQAGEVNPGTGIHQCNLDSEITLRAVAKPGYQFSHWIGDVSDSGSVSTMAYINGPKIIVAVFERVDHEGVETRLIPTTQAARKTSLLGEPRITENPGEQSVNQSALTNTKSTYKPEIKIEAVPEPAGAVLFIFGMLHLRRKRCA